MPDGTAKLRGRPEKDEETKLLAYVCARLAQRSDPDFFTTELGLDVARASVNAAARSRTWRPGTAPGWQGGPENAALRPWLLVLQPEELGLERAFIELTLEAGASQDAQFVAAGTIEGVVAVRQPLSTDRLLLDVVYEPGATSALKRRLSELAITRQRWLGIERVDELAAVHTFKGLLLRRATAAGLLRG